MFCFCFFKNLFIAYLRRSIAQRSQGLYEEATADLYKVLAIEPNNKRAKVIFQLICFTMHLHLVV